MGVEGNIGSRKGCDDGLGVSRVRRGGADEHREHIASFRPSAIACNRLGTAVAPFGEACLL